MNSRAYALFTGLFLLLLCAGVILAAIWLSGSHQRTKPYIVVTTGDVNGLSPQSRVSFRGIPAGKVDKLRFDSSDSRRILIYIRVSMDTPVTQDTYAVLKLQGVTGLSQLELESGGTSTVPLATSAQSPAHIPLQPSLLDQLSKSGSQVVTRLDALTASLNQLLDSQNQEHIARLLAQADAASAVLVKLEADLDAAARRVPALADQMQATLKQLDTLTGNLDQLAKNADKLSSSGQTAVHTINSETLPRLNAALIQISAASADIRHLADSLQKNPQQLLMGPQKIPPGPGEPGYKGPPP